MPSKDVSTDIMSQIDFKAAVSMSDIANVFSSQYESKLMASKRALQSVLKAAKLDLKTFVSYTNKSIEAVAKTDHVVDLSAYDLKRVISNIDVDFEDGVVAIRTETICPSMPQGNYTNCINQVIIEQLDDYIVNQHVLLSAEIAKQSELVRAVLADISDISRKEREILGRISSMKLQEAGMEELLNDGTLAALIQIS